MSNESATVSTSWRFYVPFIVGDAVLVAAAWLIFFQARRPMGPYEVGVIAACVALGAILGVLPVMLRHRAELKLYEVSVLKGTLAQIQNLELIAERIATATGQWQTAQEHSVKTVDAARDIGERIAAANKEFFAFMEKARDAEKAHLQLEVEKLRRAEGDWLQVLVRILDHVYAVYCAAVRSGQPGLIDQLGSFQNACRDAARRIGLTPFVVPPGTLFDPKLHQLPDASTEVPADACVGETLATGYSYQGQLVRPPLVTLRAPEAVGDATAMGVEPTPAEATPTFSDPAPAAESQFGSQPAEPSTAPLPAADPPRRAR